MARRVSGAFEDGLGRELSSDASSRSRVLFFPLTTRFFFVSYFASERLWKNALSRDTFETREFLGKNETRISRIVSDAAWYEGTAEDEEVGLVQHLPPT